MFNWLELTDGESPDNCYDEMVMHGWSYYDYAHILIQRFYNKHQMELPNHCDSDAIIEALYVVDDERSMYGVDR